MAKSVKKPAVMALDLFGEVSQIGAISTKKNTSVPQKEKIVESEKNNFEEYKEVKYSADSRLGMSHPDYTPEMFAEYIEKRRGNKV